MLIFFLSVCGVNLDGAVRSNMAKALKSWAERVMKCSVSRCESVVSCSERRD
jgi:hypothetical protein